MKIKGTIDNKTPTRSVSGSKSARGGSKASEASSSQGSKGSGAVKNSSSGTASSIEMAASERLATVARIKLEVESGEYETDSSATAEGLVNNLTDYSLA